jgi:hypothetical protein
VCAIDDAILLAFLQRPPLSHGAGKLLQCLYGALPADASIGDADALLQSTWALGRYFLAPFVDVRFDHDAYDAGLAGADLVGNGLCDFGLVAVVLEGIAWYPLSVVGHGKLV